VTSREFALTEEALALEMSVFVCYVKRGPEMGGGVS